MKSHLGWIARNDKGSIVVRNRSASFAWGVTKCAHKSDPIPTDKQHKDQLGVLCKWQQSNVGQGSAAQLCAGLLQKAEMERKPGAASGKAWRETRQNVTLPQSSLPLPGEAEEAGEKNQGQPEESGSLLNPILVKQEHVGSFIWKYVMWPIVYLAKHLISPSGQPDASMKLQRLGPSHPNKKLQCV